jgi:hypothetical protein
MIDQAAASQQILYDTMAAREVNGRPILAKILEEIDERRAAYAKRAARRATSRAH